MEHKKVVVFNGDDASPEVMIPAVEILEEMEMPIIFEYPLIGQGAFEALGEVFPDSTRAAIDSAHALSLIHI